MLKRMETVIKALEQNQISDVISFTPKKFLNVKYHGKEMSIGEKLTPTYVQNKPEVSWETKNDEYYTLMFQDPDAPSRPPNNKFGEWRHWLIANIKGNDLSTGNELASYIGSGPPENTGLHRYIFILCKQPNGPIDLNGELKIPFTAEKRNNTKAMDFIKKFNLEPEAINFYEAEHDEYVPKLYKLLGEAKDKPVEL